MVQHGDRQIGLIPVTVTLDAAGGNVLERGEPVEAWATRRDRGGRESFLGGGDVFGGVWTREYEFPGEPYRGLNEDWILVDEAGDELRIDSVNEAAYAPRTMIVVRCHRESP